MVGEDEQEQPRVSGRRCRLVSPRLVATLPFPETPCWFPPYKNSLRFDPTALRRGVRQQPHVLDCHRFKKLNWVEEVRGGAGGGGDRGGGGCRMWPRFTRKQRGLLDTGGRFILSGEAGEAPARPGATRGGERAGPTSHPEEVCVGGWVVWGLTGIREKQGCGFDCCWG